MPFKEHGRVFSVCRDEGHRFSKLVVMSVRLIEGYGIEGDAHAGQFIKHRYLAKQQPTLANNRQVHLIHSELFRELAELGFQVKPGDLGENIPTAGIDLLALPVGCLLRVGSSATIELTGLRTPCGYIDRFRKGLKRAMIVRTNAGPTFRAGVLGVVRAGGDVACGDAVAVELPARPWAPLPAL
jgi:MOSC domain-containing protein YiiM